MPKQNFVWSGRRVGTAWSVVMPSVDAVSACIELKRYSPFLLQKRGFKWNARICTECPTKTDFAVNVTCGFKWRNTSRFDQKWCLMKNSSLSDQKMPEIVAKFDQVIDQN